MARRQLAPPGGASLGLLLGQISSNGYDVIYLAKTPEEKQNEYKPPNKIAEDDDDGKKNCIKNVSEVWVADHAKHITRMLPGGMFVLGIFIVSPEDIFNNKEILVKIRNILSNINRTLSSNKYMFGVPLDHNDRLVVHFSNVKDKGIHKCIDITNVSNGSFKSANIHFQSNIKGWQQLDCYHEFDELYPVLMKKSSISVKAQFQQILESAYHSVDSSIVFLDGKLKDRTDTLESMNKRKKNKCAIKQIDEESPEAIQVSMFSPCEPKIADSVEYLECDGSTHFSGVVASRIYVNSKSTINEAITALKQDIVRSLASRFTMHCDALIHDNLLPEEKICFNEPPRRVLIRLPDSEDGNIFLCDYLFPGETPVEALMSVKEMLDANITEDDVISNIETPADTSEFDALERNPISEESSTARNDPYRSIYIVGIGIAVLIAIIAIIMQFYM